MGYDRVLVTGGTGGIGSAVCRELAANGYLPIVGSRPSSLAEARNIAQECGGSPLELDLLDGGSIAAAIENLQEDSDPLSGVVLGASQGPKLGPVTALTEADLNDFWQLAVVGNQRLLSALLKKFFRKQKSGFMVGLLSAAMGDAAGGAMGTMGGYTVGKFGLAGLLALYQAEFKWLRVHTVSPGFTDTKMLDAFDHRFIDAMREQGRVGSPDSIAKQIMTLIKAGDAGG